MAGPTAIGPLQPEGGNRLATSHLGSVGRPREQDDNGPPTSVSTCGLSSAEAIEFAKRYLRSIGIAASGDPAGEVLAFCTKSLDQQIKSFADAVKEAFYLRSPYSLRAVNLRFREQQVKEALDRHRATLERRPRTDLLLKWWHLSPDLEIELLGIIRYLLCCGQLYQYTTYLLVDVIEEIFREKYKDRLPDEVWGDGLLRGKFQGRIRTVIREQLSNLGGIIRDSVNVNEIGAPQNIYDLTAQILKPWGIGYTSAFCARISILRDEIRKAGNSHIDTHIWRSLDSRLSDMWRDCSGSKMIIKRYEAEMIRKDVDTFGRLKGIDAAPFENLNIQPSAREIYMSQVLGRLQSPG